MNRILEWLLPHRCPVCQRQFRKAGWHICQLSDVCTLCARTFQSTHSAAEHRPDGTVRTNTH